METTITVKPTPKEMAELLWSMYDDEQAEMFAHLYDIAEGEHNLMMKFLSVRKQCEDRKAKNYNDRALSVFQTLFSSAYLHAQLENN